MAKIQSYALGLAILVMAIGVGYIAISGLKKNAADHVNSAAIRSDAPATSAKTSGSLSVSDLVGNWSGQTPTGKETIVFFGGGTGKVYFMGEATFKWELDQNRIKITGDQPDSSGKLVSNYADILPNGTFGWGGVVYSKDK